MHSPHLEATDYQSVMDRCQAVAPSATDEVRSFSLLMCSVHKKPASHSAPLPKLAIAATQSKR